MKVELVSHTPDPERTVAMAVRTCHAPEVPKGKMNDVQITRLLKLVRNLGHESVFEHVSFTFAIDGVSRALTHQLVRHRIASFSQQSQRYVKLEHFSFVMPPLVKNKPDAAKLFEDTMKGLAVTYGKLADMGIPMEDARYVLPNAAESSIVVTMNARSLFNFFELRSCLKAQWEIRKLSNLMLKKVTEVAPSIFEGAGPACKSKGVCPENDTKCKFYPGD
ncbi:MAG: FAD-dependent thymidylate synthase [Candidatus Thermoplasmatota archaeon]|nr:FAD-dependent thymidylate synthase [Euryarchaeota archaeon]MBU4032862.1 FAD-dependent thymidylate synthase [Candidatus Thermoplasmatota archaeon]MBU4071491.1 FAD-dependent thymidylate synthase [Candidatus Thermoplasmatota archaeon]MBU4144095.1 FAD-dependent thymidylate synthase [Candidatus Thermoplasmatota archaeon]MBU4590987.1 FAD-dependent thymidylate synthase [Candidatus Thermoplasmatota archaeon]